MDPEFGSCPAPNGNNGLMPRFVKFRNLSTVFLGVIGLTLLFIYLSPLSLRTTDRINCGALNAVPKCTVDNLALLNGPVQVSYKSQILGYSAWKIFNTTYVRSANWYSVNCFKKRTFNFSISSLKELVNELEVSSEPDCSQMYRLFSQIYETRTRSGDLEFSDNFLKKVRSWLGNNDKYVEEAKHQTITIVSNKYIGEETIFNPLRAKRPIRRASIPQWDYVNNLTAEFAENCDFCSNNYHENTAKDPIGRIDRRHSYVAANTFKYDAWHALIIFRRHHPLLWNFTEFSDVFRTAQIWSRRVHSQSKSLNLPIITWDLLPKASASQIHPHIHITMEQTRYYGQIESWRRGAEQYWQKYSRNLFTDIVDVHRAFNLVVQYGNAVAFSSITPKKDNELVILSNEVSDDFLRLFYEACRTYIDDMEKLAYSLVVALPPVDKSSQNGRMPAMVRMITRGIVSEIRSDVTSLELFAASNVNVDPSNVMHFLKKRVSNTKLRTLDDGT